MFFHSEKIILSRPLERGSYAILKNPLVLLPDEATSGLNAEINFFISVYQPNPCHLCSIFLIC